MNSTPALSRTTLAGMLTQSLESTLQELASLPDEKRTCPLKPSRANPDIVWTPCDHVAHLIGIERYFNRQIEQVLAEDSTAAAPRANAPTRPREEAMALVHALNDQWILKHRDKSFDELVAMARETRTQTLALLERTDDARLELTLPVPWGMATLSEVFALYVRHAEMHLGFIRAGLDTIA